MSRFALKFAGAYAAVHVTTCVEALAMQEPQEKIKVKDEDVVNEEDEQIHKPKAK